jgi:rhodanese-related sulfurtransferase
MFAVVLGLLVNQLRPNGISFTGDWSTEAQLTTEAGDSLAISLVEAENLFFSGVAVFLDARSADAYASGHIEEARNLPPDELEERFPKVMAGVPEDVPIITYCDGESCALSKELALFLLDSGYSNVRVLVNGWELWRQNNLPVEADVASSQS